MQGFNAVLLSKIFQQVDHLAHLLGIGVPRFDGDAFAILFDGTERFDDEDRVMSDDGAPALRDDDGVGDRLGVADLHDVPDNVARVLRKTVVGRAFERGARAVVIDAEAAPHVDVPHLVAHFRELGVEACGFANRAFDGANVGNLGTHVEVDELEGVGKACAFEHFARGNEVCGTEPELGVFTTAGRPFSRAFGG
ncbi:MAG: hypothetical protein RIS92_3023 [Verrucomicrobiota bacterium]